MQIFVHTTAGSTVTLDVGVAEAVSSVQCIVRSKTGVPATQQRLIFGGKQLDSRLTLRDYGVQPESTLLLLGRLRGGMMAAKGATANRGVKDGLDAAEDDGMPRAFEGGKSNKVHPEGSALAAPRPRKYKDVTRFEGHAWLQSYIVCSRRWEAVATADWFGGFITAVIVLAGILVGVQTYETLDKEWVDALGTVDLIILGIFCIECIVKIVAEALEPWRYFTGPEKAWNCFDFTIVILCLPVWGDTFGGGSVALLRMMRLMRVVKLIKKIPQLQMIIMGLVGGLQSIGYIMFLLFLVFYLYGIMGIYAFRENDMWHFGDLFTAINTLFRMSTLEDWTDVMYINYHGCNNPMFDSGFYTPSPNLVNNRTVMYCPKSIGAPNSVITLLWCISFIVISALVMLSLFVGAVTMEMTTSMEKMKQMSAKAKKQKKMARAQMKRQLFKQREADEARAKAGGSPSEASPRRRRSSVARMLSFSSEAAGLSEADLEAHHLMKKVFTNSWNNEDIEDDNDEEEYNSACKTWYAHVAAKCFWFSEHKHFQNFVTVIIMLAGVMVGIQTYEEIVAEYGPILDTIDAIILGVFILECTVKIVGQAFKPWRYFYHNGLDGWNTFDFVVVAGSLLPVGDGNAGLITMLRLLRLLRVLKLVKSLPELQVIVVALVNGVASIGYIAMILFMFFYLFGILGMLLFKDNDPWHFGTLHMAMITLFRCSTLEDWTDVMYINMFGCQYYGYSGGLEHLCYTPDGGWGGVAAVYFLLFTVIGALVLMTLFIGVVTTSMEEAQANQEEEIERERQAHQVKEEFFLTDRLMEIYRQVFEQLDVDCQGTVEEDELRLGLLSIPKACWVSEAERDFYNNLSRVRINADGKEIMLDNHGEPIPESPGKKGPAGPTAIAPVRLLFRKVMHRATLKLVKEFQATDDEPLEPLYFAEFCKLLLHLNDARGKILGAHPPGCNCGACHLWEDDVRQGSGGKTGGKAVKSESKEGPAHGALAASAAAEGGGDTGEKKEEDPSRRAQDTI